MRRRVRIVLAVCTMLAAVATAVVVLPGTTPSSQAYTGKRITINVVQERLRAWVGNTVVMSTPVTTGDRYLPTPTGYYTIFVKRSPYTMFSPWPRGDYRWYPPSSMSFAMEFRAGGYFIHDAPWRTVYGKGTNAGTQPGTNYGGTHGCVNVPYNAMKFLYYWAPLGTPVHIVP